MSGPGPDPQGDQVFRLVVLADSTSFTDASGPQMPGHPGVYPTMLQKQLAEKLGRDVDLTVVARAGTTVRDLWKTVTKDRHVQFDVLMGADAVVLGIGGFDHAPSGVPAVADAIVPFVRPAALRRRLRKALHGAYPIGVRLTQGRFERTAPSVFDRLYDRSCMVIRGLANGAAGVALGPTSHRSPYYGHIHPGHAAAEQRQLAIAERHGFATVPVWRLVEPHADQLNPDGIHWPEPAHRAVADAAFGALLPQLTGDAPRLTLPT